MLSSRRHLQTRVSTWLGKHHHITQVRIDPITPGWRSRCSIRSSALDSTRNAKAPLVEKTEGTPLFLEESSRRLVETGALRGKPGALRHAGSPRTYHIPEIESLLTSRIDRLIRDNGSSVGRVIGDPVHPGILQAMGGFPRMGFVRDSKVCRPPNSSSSKAVPGARVPSSIPSSEMSVIRRAGGRRRDCTPPPGRR